MPVVELLVHRKPQPRVSAAGVTALLRGHSIGHARVERVGSVKGEGAVFAEVTSRV